MHTARSYSSILFSSILLHQWVVKTHWIYKITRWRKDEYMFRTWFDWSMSNDSSVPQGAFWVQVCTSRTSNHSETSALIYPNLTTHLYRILWMILVVRISLVNPELNVDTALWWRHMKHDEWAGLHAPPVCRPEAISGCIDSVGDQWWAAAILTTINPSSPFFYVITFHRLITQECLK